MNPRGVGLTATSGDREGGFTATRSCPNSTWLIFAPSCTPTSPSTGTRKGARARRPALSLWRGGALREWMQSPLDNGRAVCAPLGRREGRKEPRTGKRVTLAATVRTPVGDVVAYSIHLEVFTGIIGRVTQMNGEPAASPFSFVCRVLWNVLL